MAKIAKFYHSSPCMGIETKKETAESIRSKKLAEAVKGFNKKLDEAVEWIKGFAKRVPTLFDYCVQLLRAVGKGEHRTADIRPELEQL